MHLHDPGLRRHGGRDDRALKRSGGGDHMAASISPPEVSARKPVPPAFGCSAVTAMPPADRCGDPFGVGDKIVHHLVARRSHRDRRRRSANPAVCHARRGRWHADHPIFPCASVRQSGAVPGRDRRRASGLLAHRQPGLTAADDQRPDFFDWHRSTRLLRSLILRFRRHRLLHHGLDEARQVVGEAGGDQVAVDDAGFVQHGGAGICRGRSGCSRRPWPACPSGSWR